MRFAILSCVIFVGCNAGGDYESFRTAEAAAFCDAWIGCGVLGSSDRGRCIEWVGDAPARPSDPDPGVRIAAGFARLDAEAVRACLEKLPSVACGFFVEVAECLKVVVPNRRQGETCLVDDDCFAGLTCQASAPCEKRCAPGTRREIPAGGMCTGPTQCERGLVCFAGGDIKSGVCRPPAARGEPCTEVPSPSQAILVGACQPGLACDYLAAVPACSDKAALGAPCIGHDGCQDGICDGFRIASFENGQTVLAPKAGICKRPPQLGEPCVAGGSLPCPHLQACLDGVCRSKPGTGEVCRVDVGCSAGSCVPAEASTELEGICREPQPYGADCDPESIYQQCFRLGRCDPATRTCEPRSTCHPEGQP